MIEILNTIICYNNADEVVEYVKKVEKLISSDKVAVSVVINKLENGSKKVLEQKLSAINVKTCIADPQKNLGYMNGMIFGYEHFLKKHGSAKLKYVVMSNTDINYPNNSFMTDLLSREYSEAIWCIGPAVYAPGRNNYDNPICDTRRSEKEVRSIIKRFRIPVFNELYFHLSNVKGKLMKQPRGESHRVYEVHGCYFVVKKELADQMINRPFGALLYSEEAYVAEMVWHNKKSSYYDANLLVEHIEHTVTGKIDYKKISKYIADSMEVVLREFYE